MHAPADFNFGETALDVFRLGKINENLPTKKFLKKDLEFGKKLIDLLVDNNIMSSKSEARRAINNNGIKINDSMVNDEKKLIESRDFNE